jgi:P27 family predicted phage terminase small subunit
MGARGPIPKNKALKMLSGKLPITKEAAEELNKDFSLPRCPKHFGTDERKVWRMTIKLLKDSRILEEKDQAILSAYCYSVVKWRQAEKELKALEEKSVSQMFLSDGATAGTKVTNPLLTISRRYAADMVTYAAQLGMTPAARLRVQVAGPVKKDNPFKRLKASGNDNGLDEDSKGLRPVIDAETEPE